MRSRRTGSSDSNTTIYVVKQQGKFLLVKQIGSGKFGFPGGTRRANENAPCTAHRETWEEIGADTK